MATRFINNGSVLDVRFVEEDRLVWYKGVVVRMDSKNNGMCKCLMSFEDGECIHMSLRDDEYNDYNRLYTWRFLEDGEADESDLSELFQQDEPEAKPKPSSIADTMFLVLWMLVMLPTAIAACVFFVWLSYGLVRLG